MSTTSTFWKRVGSAFRINSDGGLTPDSTPTILITRDPRSPNRLDGDDDASAFSGFFPWQKRRRKEAAELRDRQSRFMELLVALKTHFEAQDRRGEQLNSSLESVAGTLEVIATAQQAQTKSMSTIAQHAESASRHAGALLATTVELPAALQAQAEAVRSVARRLEAGQATDVQLVSSLQHFGHAVDSLHQAGTLQVETLQRLHHADEQHHEQFRALIRAQNRRVYWICGLITAAFALSTAALIAALILGWIPVR